MPPVSVTWSEPPSAPSVKSGRFVLAPINRFENVWLYPQRACVCVKLLAIAVYFRASGAVPMS